MTERAQRLYALVSPGGPSNVRHLQGFPPGAGGDDRLLMPRARVVLLLVTPGGVFLYRLSETGECAGDTWHESIDAAEEQATWEYGDSIGEWRVIPESVPDPYEFALSQWRAG